MRAAGLRPVQVWLPDVRTEAFAKLARRESLAINQSDRKEDIMLFLDEHAAPWDDE